MVRRWNARAIQRRAAALAAGESGAIRRLQYGGLLRDALRGALLTALGLLAAWALDALGRASTGRPRVGLTLVAIGSGLARRGRRRGAERRAAAPGSSGSRPGPRSGLLLAVLAMNRRLARAAPAVRGAGHLELRAHARRRHGLRRRAAARGPQDGRPGAPRRRRWCGRPSSSTAIPTWRGSRSAPRPAPSTRPSPAPQIARLRTALCSPLGALGDQLFWAGLVPALVGLTLVAVVLGARMVGDRSGFLLALQHASRLWHRIWALRTGFDAGMQRRRGHRQLLDAARRSRGSARWRAFASGWRCRWWPPGICADFGWAGAHRGAGGGRGRRRGDPLVRPGAHHACASPCWRWCCSCFFRGSACDRARGDDREPGGTARPAGRAHRAAGEHASRPTSRSARTELE